MKTFNCGRVAICVIVAALLISIPQTAYCQVSRTVGKTVAKKVTKSTAKKAGKTVAKEIIEESSEKAAKMTTKKIAKESAEKAVKKEAVESFVQKGEKAATAVAATRSIDGMPAKAAARREAARMGADNSERIMGKTFKEKAVAVSENPNVKAKAASSSMKKEGKEAAAQKGKRYVTKEVAGREALSLLDNMPDVKKLLTSLETKYGPNFNIENMVVKQSNGITRIQFKNTKSAIAIKGNTIHTNSGSIAHIVNGKRVYYQGDGELNVFLNEVLPNSRYVVDDFITYETDHLGRTVSVTVRSSDLYARNLQNGIEHGSIHKQTRQSLLESFGNIKDGTDYGHIVRREVGGINEKINALPMLHSKQGSGSLWYALENKEIEACKKGSDVVGKFKIKYLSDGKYEVEVEKIINGVSTKQIFNDLY